MADETAAMVRIKLLATRLREQACADGIYGHPLSTPSEWTARAYADLISAVAEELTARPAVAQQGAVLDVLAEVERATQKFPTWPTDPLHAIAVLGEEFGELTKAVLQSAYEPHKVTAGDVRTEAIQTAAMALRFAASLDAYRYARSEQHQQPALAAAPNPPAPERAGQPSTDTAGRADWVSKPGESLPATGSPTALGPGERPATPDQPAGLSDLQDEIAEIMQHWTGTNGGVYAINGCALEVARQILRRFGGRAEPTPAEIDRGLLAHIVDTVFDGAIEDTTPIEDIYRAVAADLNRRLGGGSEGR